jgi:nickel-dependent lactate racemase
MKVAHPNAVQKTDDVEGSVLYAMDNPIGSPRIEQIVRSGHKICVICDDITRATPTPDILGVLLPKLQEAGVPKSDILIVIALGSHRKMTPEEIVQKVGREVFANYRVINSEFRDGDKLVQVGYSSLGTPIMVLKEAMEADIRIGIGTIAPHGCMGWSGGAKILYPGITSENIVSEFHVMQGLEEGIMLGMEECPVRLAVEKWAQQIELHFIINCVLTADMKLYRVVAGHFVKAHRAGIRHAREVCCVVIEEKPDVVLTASNPLDADFWQCGKALYGAANIAEKGGTLLLLAPCYEGIGPHERVIEYTGIADGTEKLKKRLASGNMDEDLLAMAVGVSMGKINAMFHVGVISDGLSREQMEIGGYNWYPEKELQNALLLALSQYADPRLLVMPAGGETVPFID